MLRKKIWIATIILMISLNGYAADDVMNIQQGAEKYDWQTCITSKSGDCMNGCETSEDINCSDNCNSLAKDKCLSEGIHP